MRNIKLTLEYDGTPYVGWQRQANGLSVQAELERALAEVTKERVAVIGSGRTDAGVHALGQVANFRTTCHIAAAKFPAALNAFLPRTITVLDAAEVDPSFHARYSATGRTYRYVVLNRGTTSAILRAHAYHVAAPLDLEAMRAALPALLGRHSFAAFHGAGSDDRSTVCTMRVADVVRRDPLVIFTFGADRFLRHMVRMLVGTLLLVGTGRLRPEALGTLLVGDSQRGGPTAPPHGLFLVGVSYARIDTE